MNHAFHPEKTGALARQLLGYLFRRICRFKQKPNQELSEAAPSMSLGVSRTPAPAGTQGAQSGAA
jgi:DNA-binding GntR family transcriptional regulator